jgi:hypothetical protein
MDAAARPSIPWYKRGWIWLASAIALLFGMIVIAFIASALFFAFEVIKSTPAYQSGIAHVTSHPEVIAALGEPIEDGTFVNGSITTSAGQEHCDFSVMLHGPTGRGEAHIVGTVTNGKWTFSTLDLKLPDGTVIDASKGGGSP